MALNHATLTSNRVPLPLPDETTIQEIRQGIDVVLSVPNAPPAGPSSTSGGVGGEKILKASGGVWITDQRFIFVAATAPPASNSLELDTLTIPHLSILSTIFHQPTFSQNFLTLTVRPSDIQAGSGLTEGTTLEIRMKDRGMFEFVALLEKTRERAIYMKRQSRTDSEADALPVYGAPDGSTSVAVGGSSSVGSGGPPPPAGSDLPPGYDA